MELSESPADLVSRISGWLLPSNESAETEAESSPSGGKQKSNAVGLFNTTPEKGERGEKGENGGATPEKGGIIFSFPLGSISAQDVPQDVPQNPQDVSESAERVLQFWFGGDMHVNYKTKWFPDGSVDTQRRADETIVTLFGELFASAVRGELGEWKKELRSMVALILVYDQFSRHIFRLHKVPTDDPRRSQADGLAIKAAEELTGRAGWDADLTVHEFVFSLMPYRHTPTTERLSGVLKSIAEREITESESLDLLHKFRKQTVRRLQHLQDIQKAVTSDSILEQAAFKADESDMPLSAVVKSTELFLRRHIAFSKGSHEEKYLQYKGGNNENSKGSKSVKVGRRTTTSGETDDSTVSIEPVLSLGARAHLPVDIIPPSDALQPVAISLSGGVDSMVIAAILVHLRGTGRLPLGTITAIHIDYANREESKEEADFVRSWCADMGIECQVRLVDEVTRGITGRDEYEKISRDIRYAFYRTVLGATGCGGVIFGHHLGDVQENVISNVMRGSSPLALSGMTEAGISNGVHVWRPLLAHPKTDILDFAHKYGVPYFKDTTPSWSTRGKLRTLLMPLLVDMYGEGCIRSLSALALESDETAELVMKNVYKPFLSSVKRHPCGLSVDISPYLTQPLCFWREMLKELMHSMGMSMVRERSVKSFLERIQPVNGSYSSSSSSSTVPFAPSSSSSSTSVSSSDLSSTSSSSPFSSSPFSPPSSTSPLPSTASSPSDAATNQSTALSMSPPKSAIGWLELRKGFHTLLTAEGTLIILRDGVLTTGKKRSQGDITASNCIANRSSASDSNTPPNRNNTPPRGINTLSNSINALSNTDDSESESRVSHTVSSDDFVHISSHDTNRPSPPISPPISPSLSDSLSPPLSSPLSHPVSTPLSSSLSSPLSIATAHDAQSDARSGGVVLSFSPISGLSSVPLTPAAAGATTAERGEKEEKVEKEEKERKALLTIHMDAPSPSSSTNHWQVGTRVQYTNTQSFEAQFVQLGPWKIKLSADNTATEAVSEAVTNSADNIDMKSGNNGDHKNLEPPNNSTDRTLSKESKESKNNKHHKDNKDRVRALQSVEQILPGHFYYYLNVPVYCSVLGVLGDNIQMGGNPARGKNAGRDTGKDTKARRTSKDTEDSTNTFRKDSVREVITDGTITEFETVLDAPALNGMDLRLKTGLPLLVPIVRKDDLLSDGKDGKECVLLRLDYTFNSF